MTPPPAICGPKAEDRNRSRRRVPGRLVIWDRKKTADIDLTSRLVGRAPVPRSACLAPMVCEMRSGAWATRALARTVAVRP